VVENSLYDPIFVNFGRFYDFRPFSDPRGRKRGQSWNFAKIGIGVEAYGPKEPIEKVSSNLTTWGDFSFKTSSQGVCYITPD